MSNGILIIIASESDFLLDGNCSFFVFLPLYTLSVSI